MTANTNLIHAIADALIDEYGEEATGWLEDGGRANVARILGEWRTAIEEGRWIERVEDVLVLRALRHEAHWVEVLGGPDAEALIRELVDEDWCQSARKSDPRSACNSDPWRGREDLSTLCPRPVSLIDERSGGQRVDKSVGGSDTAVDRDGISHCGAGGLT